ncbi:MAG TPA: GIY-YIG nuclease family protein [Patescibacteria group bacterium]|nr:GIY-YIG nuclease family protein [Patescibacteria group bacterium]
MFSTYILISREKQKTYTGHTDNLKRRLIEHNSGRSTFSKRHVPWIVLYEELFETKKESIKKERYFKSAAGRRWIKKNLFNNK